MIKKNIICDYCGDIVKGNRLYVVNLGNKSFSVKSESCDNCILVEQKSTHLCSPGCVLRFISDVVGKDNWEAFRKE